MTSIECGHCGAAAKNAAARFCAFCGTEIVREGVPRAETPYESRRTRFELMRSHPDLERWLAHEPEVPPAIPRSAWLLGVPFFAVFIGFLVFFMTAANSTGAPKFFLVVPLLMLAGVVFFLVKSAGRVARYNRAPLEKRPAIVVDERVHVSGGGKNSSASTFYYATIELDDGERRELRVHRRLAGELTEGDAGVAFVKHEALIGFRRIPV